MALFRELVVLHWVAAKTTQCGTYVAIIQRGGGARAVVVARAWGGGRGHGQGAINVSVYAVIMTLYRASSKKARVHL